MKSAFQEFNFIEGRINGLYHEAAVRLGLSDSVFWILYVLLTHEEGVPQPLLCRETGMAKTTVNSALKKLEREGLLRLAPDRGRSTTVLLTEMGTALAERTVGRLITLENEIHSGWSPEQQQMFLSLNRDFLAQISVKIAAL